MTKIEFIAAVLLAAQESHASSGFPVGIAVAQAALESAWGKSELSQKANNYFGIKAHGDAGSITLATTEVVKGKTVKTQARFAAFPDMRSCFADRDRILRSLACYQDARANATNPEEFTRCLARHWATDPKYADKVLKIYRDNTFDRFDQ